MQNKAFLQLIIFFIHFQKTDTTNMPVKTVTFSITENQQDFQLGGSTINNEVKIK